ncbi:histidinol phosphate phosphatase HisJ family [Coriobacterium glomerans PW2]|uniref:Histidinol-phosphatase n=1 Tax=Coriobacterium glomerans (strain ATCC 49209 / DSM 20642 / JCM 10262 / PW2) TaxID=700015 RepID=F2N7N3_CORGP|nr:histidinol-phosphatase HisJ family protein [Coriobacterium glomerans]AEB06925.1 histidinol phosphate phosphatase HisJ family [Coriobacterium glomerans PW2]
MLADYHVHSAFSDDSNYAVRDICRDALRLNLDEICFTDHVDPGVKPEFDHPESARIENGTAITNVDYKSYFPEIQRMRERCAPDLRVRCGLELGVQTGTAAFSAQLVERYRSSLDFVILSIHQIDNLELWTGEFQAKRSRRACYEAYYEEMLRVQERFDGYSVLGHLDLIRRYDSAGPWPFERNRDIIAAILSRAIADGKGIEVNTSSFRYGLDDLQPSTEILELYRDLGGRILTIGSDSHKPEHLGSWLSLVARRLEAMGFSELCTFERMEPVFHPLR